MRTSVVLWRFFRKKMRKQGWRGYNPTALPWAVRYTWHHYRWLRIERDPVKYQAWLDD